MVQISEPRKTFQFMCGFCPFFTQLHSPPEKYSGSLEISVFSHYSISHPWQKSSVPLTRVILRPFIPTCFDQVHFLTPLLGSHEHCPCNLPNQPSLFLNINISTLNMEAACSSETWVSIHTTAHCHNSDHNLNNHHHENVETNIPYRLSSNKISPPISLFTMVLPSLTFHDLLFFIPF